MKKIFYFPVFLFIFLSNTVAQTYPTTFNWAADYSLTGVPYYNQEQQGPCNCFAVANAAEDWYYLLYGNRPYMSRQHLFSACNPGGTGPVTSPLQSLELMQNTGIVDNVNLPYGNSVTDKAGMSEPYYANVLGTTPNFPCFAPHEVTDSLISPPRIFYVSSYQLLDLTQYSTLDSITRLKKMLLNYGPITLNFQCNVTGIFHNVATHAYVLYGWSGTGNNTTWYFQDSWPNWPTGYSTYTGNFLGLIKSGQITIPPTNGGPYVLTPSGSTKAVYVDSTHNSGSTYVPGVVKPYVVPNTSLDTFLHIDINGYVYTTANQYMCNISSAVLSIENGSIFNSYSNAWGYSDPTGSTAAITFSNRNSATPSVGVSSEGYVTLLDTVMLPNGIQILVTRANVYVSTGIPFKLVQTYDACSGTTRSIQWQVESRMANNNLPSTITITTPWTFTPAPGTSPSTFYGQNVLPNDKFNIDYYNLTTPTGYGIHVTLTDAGYNNIVDGTTVGQSEQSCGSGYEAIKLPSLTTFPNPTRTALNISVPLEKDQGQTYVIKLTDMNGHILIAKEIKGSTTLDVSKYARGSYIIQFIPSNKKEPITYQKVVHY